MNMNIPIVGRVVSTILLSGLVVTAFEVEHVLDVGCFMPLMPSNSQVQGIERLHQPFLGIPETNDGGIANLSCP